MTCSVLSFMSEHPIWITLWLVLIWFSVGEYLDYRRGGQ